MHTHTDEVWLTAKELAAEFEVTADTIYRWRQEGIIPRERVRFSGRVRLLFSSRLVRELNQRFER